MNEETTLVTHIFICATKHCQGHLYKDGRMSEAEVVSFLTSRNWSRDNDGYWHCPFHHGGNK